MARSKMKNTKYEILQCATKSFLERGYTDTYVTVVAKDLGISTGNLTFHYPTKEHILAEMLKELCAFQTQADAKEADKKYSLLIEYLFELAMDYRSGGNHVFEEFCSFVEQKMKDNYGKR